MLLCEYYRNVIISEKYCRKKNTYNNVPDADLVRAQNQCSIGIIINKYIKCLAREGPTTYMQEGTYTILYGTQEVL